MNLHVVRPFPGEAARKRFTWDDVVAMGAAGLFAEGERVELIAGEIFVMPPEGPDHANAVQDFVRWLRGALPANLEAFARAPVRLNDGVVVPDVSVFPDGARAEDMQGASSALVIEISRHTQTYDLDGKAPRYAAAGCPELWVMDLAKRRLFVFREPSAEGWGSVRTYAPGESASPLCAPESAWGVK